VKPGRFDYVRADSVDEVHAVLVEEGDDARVLAGGQTLVPMLSMRMARPRVLVDVMHLPELATIEDADGTLRIRAGVRQAVLLEWPVLAKRQPLLAATLPWIGHPQTRSRGTVCGSIAHADPSAELPLALLALNGTVELSSHAGRRRIPAGEFFIGIMSTACRADELIEAVEVPSRQPGQGFGFREYGRRHGDFAIVACAAVAAAHGVRIAVTGVADRPIAKDYPALEGGALDDALDQLASSIDVRSDLHASADYRRRLVRHLGKAAVTEAYQCRA
jgi:2-furoyl-CoA dehydrogenase FAD binding subunit